MIKANLGKEIVLKVTNEIGILNRLCKMVSEKGINVIAVHGTVDGDSAVIRLITADNLRVGDALRAHHYAPHEQDCVLVELPNKPGVLRTITEKLAGEMIDLHHLYATTAPGHDNSLVVFGSSNNDRALIALKR